MWEAQTDSRVLTISQWSCNACYAVSASKPRLERSAAAPLHHLLSPTVIHLPSIQWPNHPISGNQPRLGRQGTYAPCTQLKYITMWVFWLWKFGEGDCLLHSRAGWRGNCAIFFFFFCWEEGLASWILIYQNHFVISSKSCQTYFINDSKWYLMIKKIPILSDLVLKYAPQEP